MTFWQQLNKVNRCYTSISRNLERQANTFKMGSDLFSFQLIPSYTFPHHEFLWDFRIFTFVHGVFDNI